MGEQTVRPLPSTVSEIENRWLRAIELDPSSIEALQEAAHFYDAVESDAARARDYAFRCRQHLSAVVEEMDGILAGGFKPTHYHLDLRPKT